MSNKKPKRYFVRILQGGAGILIKANPHTISQEGKVYEVDRSLWANLINREKAESLEIKEALKLVDEDDSDDEKELEDYKVPELKEIADQEGVNIEGLSKKAEIIAAIRAKSEASD